MESFLIIGGLAVLVMVLSLVSKETQKGTRRKAGGRRDAKTPSPKNNWGMTDPSRQLEAVGKVAFKSVKIMNTREFRVFEALEDIVAEIDGGHRVMAQVSLGEVIRPHTAKEDWKDRKNAFAAINSKRLDFAVIDRGGHVALAVEYQGDGHHQDRAYMRDAVKKEALRRAGVAFLEVETGCKPSEFRMRVRNALGVDAPRIEAAE